MRDDICRAREQGQHFAREAASSQPSGSDPVQQALDEFDRALPSYVQWAEAQEQRSVRLSTEPPQGRGSAGIQFHGEDLKRFIQGAGPIARAAGLRFATGKTPVQREWGRRVGGGYDYIEISW